MLRAVSAARFHRFYRFCAPLSPLAYVDEHVEARYEEIINHLHKALSSTEEDEQDFKVMMVNEPEKGGRSMHTKTQNRAAASIAPATHKYLNNSVTASALSLALKEYRRKRRCPTTRYQPWQRNSKYSTNKTTTPVLQENTIGSSMKRVVTDNYGDVGSPPNYKIQCLPVAGKYVHVHQKQAKDLQGIIEQLSANKADRRELLELKQFMVSLNVGC